MYRIEYEVKVNEFGRPYISLSEDYEQRPEDRFLAIEITRYILQDLLNRRKPDLDENTVEKMSTSASLLGQIGDSVAELLWNAMRNQGDIMLMLDSKYHIQVNSIDERDNLSMEYIYYNDKIFKRQEGLKVLVLDNETVYTLKNGINNENWTTTNVSQTNS